MQVLKNSYLNLMQNRISTLALIGWAMVFWGCQRLDISTSTRPKSASCHSCHQSPPPTGEHFYHIYTQNSRSQISCDECHNTAIKKMDTFYKMSINSARLLFGFETRNIQNDSLQLIIPHLHEVGYNMCETRFKDDAIYSAKIDSLSSKVTDIAREDSLYATYTKYIYFPIHPDWKKQEPGKRGKKTYLKPFVYDRCEHEIQNSGIHRRVIDDFSIKELDLSEKNQFTAVEEENMYYVLIPDSLWFDTLVFALKTVSQTPVGFLPEKEKKRGISIFEGKEHVLIGKNKKYYRLTNDSLSVLNFDTLTDFSKPVFATTTGLHGNGIVDIGFKHEKFTIYKEDTLEVRVSPTTGEVESIQFRRIGSWNPKRKTCYYGGISNAECHPNVYEETNWYPKRDPKKSRLSPLGTPDA